MNTIADQSTNVLNHLILSNILYLLNSPKNQNESNVVPARHAQQPCLQSKYMLCRSQNSSPVNTLTFMPMATASRAVNPLLYGKVSIIHS